MDKPHANTNPSYLALLIVRARLAKIALLLLNLPDLLRALWRVEGAYIAFMHERTTANKLKLRKQLNYLLTTAAPPLPPETGEKASVPPSEEATIQSIIDYVRTPCTNEHCQTHSSTEGMMAMVKYIATMADEDGVITLEDPDTGKCIHVSAALLLERAEEAL